MSVLCPTAEVGVDVRKRRPKQTIQGQKIEQLFDHFVSLGEH